jgi:NAD(P)-dependent dehydrogenase (short-subunit alcohol dehydrogenase family)
MSLAGRIALVTGAGRGIGRAIALGLAQDGADIAVNYRRDGEAAAETVAAVRALGRRAEAFQASVDDFEADRAMIDAVGVSLGDLSILVNNAGIASRGQSVADGDPAEMERVVRVHAFGPFYLAKLALPMMRRQARGDIVMISRAVLDHTESFDGCKSAFRAGAMRSAMRGIGQASQRTRKANLPHRRPGSFAPRRRRASYPMPHMAWRRAPCHGAK